MSELVSSLLFLGLLLAAFLFLVGHRRAWTVLVWVVGLGVLTSFALPVLETSGEVPELGTVAGVLGLLVVLVLLGRRSRSSSRGRDRETRPTSAKRRLERD